jgi:hypothetical protein
MVDRILKFENLKGDWEKFLASLKLNGVQLPHVKKIADGSKKRNFLTRRVFDLIKSRYLFDFEVFGYSTDYLDYKL